MYARQTAIKRPLLINEAIDDEVAVTSAGPYAMQIICTLHQTDNHASTLSLNFLQAGITSWHPANSVKALKAIK